MSHPNAADKRDRLAFDKWDHLGLRVTLWVVAVAATAGLVGVPLLHWLRGERLAVPFVSEVQVSALDAVGMPHSAATYRVYAAEPSASQRLLDLVPGVLVVAVVIAIVALLLRFVRDVGAGDPFAPSQVGRLRTVAALLLFGTPVIFAVQLVCNGLILGRLDLGGLPPSTEISIPWLPLLLGMCVALVAEAFKTGTRLRDDVDGLI